MTSWWVTSVLDSPGGGILLFSWVVWVIGSIVLHELGHGWAAIACGDDTPRRERHMTLNPLVHMGWPSLLLFAILGMAYGRMPVNPANFKSPWDDVIVALAGPMMNVLLAVGAIIADCVWVAGAGGAWSASGGLLVSGALYSNIHTFLHMGAVLNIALALFNLLPLPPLDGSRVAAGIIPGVRELYATPIGTIASIAVLVLMFSGGSWLIDAGSAVHYTAARRVLSVIAPAAASQRPSGAATPAEQPKPAP